ncbi:fibronectin type III domain-containing protein [Chryseobacterium sp. PMSZPI]|uniref:fibronectin type III domain-containing protein n=1 Tax=Chryseobacterium sp. PMSZPI TaxID=1033900 RepID=UPI00161C13A3|nr:fibronectin type III domain-containing protein [Chryseobacterium sp. PMSZPI]
MIAWLVVNSCNPLPSLPIVENFNSNNGGFVFMNSAQSNNWFYGNATGNPVNSIYISNNNGISNSYNINETSITHTYKDVAIPPGTIISNLSFDWRAAGEDQQDYLKVWLVPTSYTPIPGSPITVGSGRIQVGSDFNQKAEWQTYLNDNLNLSSFAGLNMRLVFEWTNNNNNGLQPPASVDNILLTTCRIPGGMSVSGITPNTATLNWLASPSTPNGGYDYYISTVNIPPDNSTPPTGNSTLLSANVNSLSSNTTYYWWLRSVCSASDRSPWIAAPSFSTTICNTSVPTVTINNITHNSATINWPLNSGNSSYIVKYRPVGSLNWIITNLPLATPPLTVNTLDLTGTLLPGTIYEIEIAAVCDGIEGTYSHNEFSTKCDPTPPNVSIDNITTNSAIVTWSPLSANSTYILRYRKVGSSTWIDVNNIPLIPGNTYTITGLDVYTAYEVQVASICDGEVAPNPYSNPKVFTTERTCELPPPGLTITNLTTTTAVVNWDPFPGSTYILRYRKTGIPSWTTVPVPTNTYTLTGLLELTKYEMQVANICNGTLGNYTDLFFFTTPTIIYCDMSAQSSAGGYISKVTVKPNGKPIMENTSLASLYTNYTGDSSKFIELIQGSAGNEIIIEKNLNNNNKAGIAAWIDFNRDGFFDINERILVSSPNSSTTIEGKFNIPTDAFISMTDYKYVVMRVALQKDGIPINCTNFNDGEVEDYTVKISKAPINNPINQSDILIYPNPVRSILHIKNISEKVNYKIYNLAGELVSNGIILNNKINISSLLEGVYVIDIQDGETNILKKFIKE